MIARMFDHELGVPTWASAFVRDWRTFLPPIGAVLRDHHRIDFEMDRGDDEEHIYFLLSVDDDGVSIRYIGRTTQWSMRMAAHCRRWPVQWYSTFAAPARYADTIEAFYVSLIRPPFNTRRESGTFLTDALLTAAHRGILWSAAEPPFRLAFERR